MSLRFYFAVCWTFDPVSMVHLLNMFSYDEGRKDLGGSTDSEAAAAVEMLAETVSENDPASPRYQAGLHDDIRKESEGRAVYRR